jgi:hypothetical protein
VLGQQGVEHHEEVQGRRVSVLDLERRAKQTL